MFYPIFIESRQSIENELVDFKKKLVENENLGLLAGMLKVLLMVLVIFKNNTISFS